MNSASKGKRGGQATNNPQDLQAYLLYSQGRSGQTFVLRRHLARQKTVSERIVLALGCQERVVLGAGSRERDGQ